MFVHPDPDLAEEFPVGRSYSTGSHGSLTVGASMLHRGLRVVRFAEVADRDAAAELYGVELRRGALPTDTDRETLWSDDLLGSVVVDDEGHVLGRLTGVSDGAAHDYLVVTNDAGRQALVPAVADLVTIERGQVIIRPIPGLLSPDDEG